MKRITLIALAVAGLSFAAAPSYAQSSYGGGNANTSYGDSAEQTAARAARKAERAAKKAEKKLLKEQAMQAKEASSATDAKAFENEPSSAVDAKVMAKEPSSAVDAKMMKGDVMMKDEMMEKSESIRPTNCPSGTEPQDNGTCMLK